jgi:hypothetical protein
MIYFNLLEAELNGSAHVTTGYVTDSDRIVTNYLIPTGYDTKPVHIVTNYLTTTGYDTKPVHIATNYLTTTGYDTEPDQSIRYRYCDAQTLY